MGYRCAEHGSCRSINCDPDRWTNDQQPADANEWLATATRHEGSWWPTWTQWLTRHGSKKSVPAHFIGDGIEPAPGSYAMMK